MSNNNFGISLRENLNAVNLSEGRDVVGVFCYFDKGKTYEHCTKEEVLERIKSSQQRTSKVVYGASICYLATVAVHCKNSFKAYSSRGYTVTLGSDEESLNFWLENYEKKYGSVA